MARSVMSVSLTLEAGKCEGVGHHRSVSEGDTVNGCPLRYPVTVLVLVVRHLEIQKNYSAIINSTHIQPWYDLICTERIALHLI
jgi:hypothetical protein